MDKVLLVARLGKFFSDFEMSDISILQEMGYEVWCAANFENDNHKLDKTGVKKIHLSFRRSPLSVENLRECRKLEALMEKEHFKLVHCHMPIGGVFARRAAKRTKTTPVFYTAHGFQFAKGGPKRDWILFYPVEKFLSKYTDVLITINHEDYELAKNKFHMRKAVYLNGIGIDIHKFSHGKNIRNELGEELGIPQESYLMLSVGELSKRKNHQVVLRGLAQLGNSNVHYLICGIGALDKYLEELVKELGIEKQVHFLGYREDIADICKSVDVFAFPSKREGLPVALMEAMVAGLPIIASKARGNTELVEDGVNGILCEKNTPEEYAEAIRKMQNADKEMMIQKSLEKIEKYDLKYIREEMKALYERGLAK